MSGISMSDNGVWCNGRLGSRLALGLCVATLFFVAGNDQGLCAETTGVSAEEFLNSLGINTHIDQGISGGSYVEPLRYLGVRNIRDGGRNLLQTKLVNRETGVRLDLMVGGDLDTAISTGRALAASGALMAFEGPNEPNNFPIVYNGEKGGGAGSWAPVARLQRALYEAVKTDPDLRQYPVLAVSEAGAETDNVGLQFLTIPAGVQTTFPIGTKFADYANPHNYVSSTRAIYVNNQAWNAADPILNGPWDGLFVEYGETWGHHYPGYANDDLKMLPRVTTETGWDSVAGFGGERIQGTILVNTYLAQFKRGWRYTFIYQLRDGEGGVGNQGLFNANSTPKLAAVYIHNLTTILADKAPVSSLGSVNYSIPGQPATVHDLLIQKSTGAFELAVWDENASGSDNVKVDLGHNYSTVNIYDITAGIRPIQVLTNVGSVSLNLHDHPLIIELIN
jgi:hypothetical protein